MKQGVEVHEVVHVSPLNPLQGWQTVEKIKAKDKIIYDVLNVLPEV